MKLSKQTEDMIVAMIQLWRKHRFKRYYTIMGILATKNPVLHNLIVDEVYAFNNPSETVQYWNPV